MALKSITFFFILLLGFACKQTESTSHSIKEVSSSNTQSSQGVSRHEDKPMSDSTVAELLKAASTSQDPQPIDFATCQKLNRVDGLLFDMAAIGKYHNQVENFVEYCLYVVEKEEKKVYIIFNNEIESHYSPYFKLLKIDGRDTVSTTTLAQIYGNEQYDYILSAKGVGNDQFELTKSSTYRYIQGIGKVDSASNEVQILNIWEGF